MLSSSDEFVQARKYDQMIPWEKRLKREIPFIASYLESGSVLDVACSSGRHSFALENLGYQTVGIDISAEMIAIALELKEEKSSQAKFLVCDAAGDVYTQLISQDLPTYYENAILLGNSIANVGSYDKGKHLLQNIFQLVLPRGKFITQTVFRPLQPHYPPLRHLDGTILQRIMVPVYNRTHNTELHVNIIDPKTGEYLDQKSDNQFYMYTQTEFAELITRVGWKITAVYGGYGKEAVKEESGATLVWILEKPDIPMHKETLDLFSRYNQMSSEEIRKRTLKIWQHAIGINQYHCIRGYRFLYPRITSHSRYVEIIAEISHKRILDIGCHMGTDIRQLIIDGANAELMVGMDQSEEFIQLGYELFNDKKELQVKFHQCNIVESHDDLSDKFQSTFDIIHAGSLLHLLSKEENIIVVKKVHQMLKDGGMFFGRAVGRHKPITMHIEEGLRYLYSPESLKQHLLDHGFSEIEVDVADTEAPLGERSDETHLTMFFYAKK
ncbi:MAG: methyltransferase domain-containing protein [Candidatus Kariarchaeaceae archaeon]|jgi:SAM-dependent methyltransferase